MRELDSEEHQLLRTLDGGVSTADLIVMVRDMGEILRARGHVVQANVAELAADRLASLSASSGNAVTSPSNADRSSIG